MGGQEQKPGQGGQRNPNEQPEKTEQGRPGQEREGQERKGGPGRQGGGKDEGGTGTEWTSGQPKKRGDTSRTEERGTGTDRS